MYFKDGTKVLISLGKHSIRYMVIEETKKQKSAMKKENAGKFMRLKMDTFTQGFE